MKKKWVLSCLLVAIFAGGFISYCFLGRESPQRHDARIAACLILLDGNKTVLGLRKSENKYGLIGGHIEAEETIYQGVIRETKEEAGIDLDPKDLQVVHVMHYEGRLHDYIFFFVRANSWEGKIVNREPKKCAGWEWFETTNLPQNMATWAHIGLENIQKGIFFSEYRNESKR